MAAEAIIIENFLQLHRTAEIIGSVCVCIVVGVVFGLGSHASDRSRELSSGMEKVAELFELEAAQVVSCHVILCVTVKTLDSRPNHP